MSPTLAILGAVAVTILAGGAPARAGAADVEAAVAIPLPQSGPDIVRFRVTVRHVDAGWDHYADRWEVLAGDGTILGTRELAHPHVDEQPFTRSADIAVPASITEVRVRAHDKVHGFGGREVVVTIRR